MSGSEALLLVSFGGPESMVEVRPFIEKIVAGKRVSQERLDEVEKHYAKFDGVSPLNGEYRALKANLEAALSAAGHALPIYIANLNTEPSIEATIVRLVNDGIEKACVFLPSPYAGYSSCRKYRERIREALDTATGATAADSATATASASGGLQIVFLRRYFNHPLFIAAWSRPLVAALAQCSGTTRVIFTAHSVPRDFGNAESYLAELEEVARLVAEAADVGDYELVFQSRSGPPQQAWLEPDICDHLRKLGGNGSDGAGDGGVTRDPHRGRDLSQPIARSIGSSNSVPATSPSPRLSGGTELPGGVPEGVRNGGNGSVGGIAARRNAAAPRNSGGEALRGRTYRFCRRKYRAGVGPRYGSQADRGSRGYGVCAHKSTLPLRGLHRHGD